MDRIFQRLFQQVIMKIVSRAKTDAEIVFVI